MPWDGGHVTLCGRGQGAAAAEAVWPHKLELWFRKEESGREGNRRRGKGWVSCHFSCLLCSFCLVLKLGNGFMKKEKKCWAWRVCVEAACFSFCQVFFAVLCLDWSSEAERWSLSVFCEEVCGKTVILFDSLILSGISSPLLSHCSVIGESLGGQHSHSSSPLLFFLFSPTHCVLCSATCIDGQASKMKLDCPSWPIKIASSHSISDLSVILLWLQLLPQSLEFPGSVLAQISEAKLFWCSLILMVSTIISWGRRKKKSILFYF